MDKVGGSPVQFTINKNIVEKATWKGLTFTKVIN
jgi:hypothetical protein